MHQDRFDSERGIRDPHKSSEGVAAILFRIKANLDATMIFKIQGVNYLVIVKA
jgi:hypothetical protein